MQHIQQPRRKFLYTGIVGFCTALFAGLPKISFAKSASGNDKGIIVRDRSKVVLCDECLRITIGTIEENKKLIEELSKYKSN